MSRFDIDLELAAGGYLRTPDGRMRLIPGLEPIARATAAAGIRVRWGKTADDAPGCSYPKHRQIVLAPWVYDQPGEAIRDVWLHELGHCVVGRDEARVRRWQLAWQAEQLVDSSN